jgi:hypothetical protein
MLEVLLLQPPCLFITHYYQFFIKILSCPRCIVLYWTKHRQNSILAMLGERNCSFITGTSLFSTVQTSTGDHSPRVQSGISLGVKQLRHEADQSTHSSAEFMNECSHTSTPSYAFIVCTENTLFFSG